MRLPSVTFAVIPTLADRRGYRMRESFSIVDHGRVTIELISGYLSLTHPAEVAMYTEAWEHLSALARFGKGTQELIRAAIAALDAPA